MLHRLFTEHPASVDETYLEHLGVATSFGVHMLVTGIACFVHALFPFLFVKTGGRAIEELYERMVTSRRRHAPGRLAGRDDSDAKPDYAI